MSSFRWGMVAWSTLTYGQMAYRKGQATYVFSSLQYCCFPSCFCLISLGSAAIPLHFRLSFCNPLVQIRSPYLIWKRTFRAICLYKNLDYGPSDRHFMTKFLKEMGQASYLYLFGANLLPLRVDVMQVSWARNVIPASGSLTSVDVPRDLWKPLSDNWGKLVLEVSCSRSWLHG